MCALMHFCSLSSFSRAGGPTAFLQCVSFIAGELNPQQLSSFEAARPLFAAAELFHLSALAADLRKRWPLLGCQADDLACPGRRLAMRSLHEK